MCWHPHIVLLAGLILAPGWIPEASAQEALQVERGQEVYADQRCRLCHSIEGEGNTNGPLDGVGSRLTHEEIELWMINPQEMTAKTNATRRPPMRAYPDLAAEDLEALVSYMLSLK